MQDITIQKFGVTNLIYKKFSRMTIKLKAVIK